MEGYVIDVAAQKLWLDLSIVQIALGWDLSFTKCVGSVISKKGGEGEREREVN